MRPVLLLGLALFAAPLAATGQSYSVPVAPSFGIAGMESMGAPTPIQNLYFPAASTCPVAFQAKHGTDGNVIKTGKGHPKGHGQVLHLTFTSPNERVLAKVTLSITGWTGNGHFQPTANRDRSREPASQGVRRLEVPLTAGPGRTATAEVWVPGITAVDAIELVSAWFADGSTWTAPANQCSVKPDPLMLVTEP